MKTLSEILPASLGLTVLGLSLCTARSVSGQNLLADPGFESGLPVAGGIGGWEQLNASAFSHDYVHGGVWSLRDAYDSGAVGPVVAGIQSVPATPGSVFLLSGWGFTPTMLSDGAGYLSRGYLMAVFLDSGGNLINTGPVFYEVGRLDTATPAQTWTFLSGTVTAPANTAYVEVLAELFGGAPGTVVYFDDLNLTLVPEPSSVAVMGCGLAVLVVRRMRR